MLRSRDDQITTLHSQVTELQLEERSRAQRDAALYLRAASNALEEIVILLNLGLSREELKEHAIFSVETLRMRLRAAKKEAKSVAIREATRVFARGGLPDAYDTIEAAATAAVNEALLIGLTDFDDIANLAATEAAEGIDPATIAMHVKAALSSAPVEHWRTQASVDAVDGALKVISSPEVCAGRRFAKGLGDEQADLPYDDIAKKPLEEWVRMLKLSAAEEGGMMAMIAAFRTVYARWATAPTGIIGIH